MRRGDPARARPPTGCSGSSRWTGNRIEWSFQNSFECSYISTLDEGVLNRKTGAVTRSYRYPGRVVWVRAMPSGLDLEAGRAFGDPPNHGRLPEALAVEGRQHLVHGVRVAGHQQATAGLRVGQQGLVCGGKTRGQCHLLAVSDPVAAGRSGDHALGGQFAHATEQGHVCPVDLDRAAAASGHFQRMAGQGEAGHVGERMHAWQGRQRRAGGVQTGGGVDHLRVAFGGQCVLLQGGRQHAHAQRLAQHQHVTGLGACIALDAPGVDQAQGDQAVDGLDRVDGVTARDRDAGGLADAGAAFEDAADGGSGQHVDRHADQGQRHDGRAAHGVHIADGVGGGNAAKVEGVVDDGHEKVGGGDQGLFVVEPVNGRVVGGFDAHQQLGRYWQCRGAAQDVGQHARGDLAAAAAAMGEGSQTGFGGVHASKACANSRASKVSRSSSFSPTPMKYTGIGFSRAMAQSTPPLAVPSSLVTIRPVSCRASSKALTCASAFWPVLPSITSTTSWGAVASAFCTTRLIFFSSSIRWSWVGKRPAVSTTTTALPRALPADTASKLTAAGSPPSWLTMSTVLRWAQTPNCSRAAARKVSAAASSTLCPSLARCQVNFPMVVVLPAPFTPATMITVGPPCWLAISSPCSRGDNRSVIAAASRPLTAAGSVVLVVLTRCFRSLSRCCVAPTPVSAINSSLSRSS